MATTTKRVFCEECRKDVSYTAFSRMDTQRHRGIEVECDVLVALCDVCDNEVYIGAILVANMDALQKAYEGYVGAIQVANTNALQKAYEKVQGGL
jgi:hypothetical protein